MGKPRVVVPAGEIRRLFNVGDYEGRLARGELVVRIEQDSHPARPLANEPFCTRSQYLLYVRRRDGTVVAGVHRYLRRDNTIGLSGRPDPKRLYLADRIVLVEQPKDGGGD